MTTETLDRIFPHVRVRNPVSRDALMEAGRELGFTFPPDYVDFMVTHGAIEGPIGEENYLCLCPAEKLVDYNRQSSVRTDAPFLILFGSDGGGAVYAFDGRESPPLIVERWVMELDPDDFDSFGTSF